MAGSVINVLIAGDARKLKDALGEADGMLGKFGKAAGTVAKVAAASFAAIGAAGVVFAKKSIDAASNLEESLSKVSVVFGDQADTIEDWASRSAVAFGQSKQQALEAAGTYGNLFQAFGVGRKDAADMSTSLVELAADLASFNNTSVDDALLALRSGLSGEAEPLKRFGVALTDARLKEQAFSMGLISSTKDALDPAAKSQAAYALIMKDSSLAQGDFARTSDGLANQQRIVAAQFEDLKATLGTALLPVVGKVMGALSAGMQTVMPVVQEFADIFREKGLGAAFDFAREKVEQFLPIIQDKLTQLGQALIDWIGPRIQPMLTKLGELLSAALTWIATVGLPMLQEKLAQLGVALIEWVGPQIPPLLHKIAELVGRLGSWLIETGLPRLVDNLKRLGDALVAWVGPNIAPLLKELGIMIGRVVSWILTDGIPKLLQVALEIAGALTKWAFELLPPILKGLGQLVWELVKALPGLFVDLVTGIGKIAADLGKRLVEGLWDGITGMSGWLLDKLKEWAGNLIPGWLKNILGIQSPSRVTAEIGQQIAAGMAVGIEEGSTHVFRASENLGKNLEKALAGGSKKAISKARKAIEDELKQIAKAAEDTMDAIKKQAQDVLDFAADISSSLGRFGSIASFDTLDPENKPTAKGVIQNMADRLKTIRAFGDNLRSLASLGLNNVSLQEILAAGPEAGNQIAAALLKEGQSAVSQVNSLQEQVFGAASNLAEFATQQQYGMSTAQARAQINSSVVIETGAVVVNVGNDANGDGIADTVETVMREVAEQIARDEVTRQLDYFGGEIERTSGGLTRLVNL